MAFAGDLAFAEPWRLREIMLNRRQFHLSLLGSLAATALAAPRGLVAGTAPAPDRWLNRLSFGATGPERDRFLHLGLTGWLDDQLSRPPADTGITARLAAARLQIVYASGSDENGNRWTGLDELRKLSALAADPADHVRLTDRTRGMDFAERVRPAAEVIAAALIRAVHAPAQLAEVMTQFWHDHFNVNAMKDEFTAAFFPAHDAALRENALGNFRQLRGRMARSPAMLYYLNNADSRASPANENYARELLELHTLGAANYLNDRYDTWRAVPQADGRALGYLDLDVYEVARAFTGWTVGDGRYVSDGYDAPKTGRFHDVEAWHDPYQKRVLGVEFPANRAAMADGDQVLDLLANHPGTARHLCTKIARRLLTDSPAPALIDQLLQVFLNAQDAPDQIAQVVRALVLHPGFAATPPGKLRRPFEYLAALYRATGAEVTGTTNAQHWQLFRAGWRQHEYPIPTGHPDILAKWTGASSLNRLVDFALYAHDDWFGVVSVDLAAHVEGESLAQFVDRWSAPLGSTGLAVHLGLDPAMPAAAFSPDERRGAAAGAVAFAATTPDFLLR